MKTRTELAQEIVGRLKSIAEEDLSTAEAQVLALAQRELPDPTDPYPEHVKLHQVNELTQSNYEFLEWLEENGYVLARWADKKHNIDPDRLYPDYTPKAMLVSSFHGIDTEKLEAEKVKMLDGVRRLIQR